MFKGRGIKPQGAAALVLLALLGLTLTVFGIWVRDESPFLFNVLTALGGTAFGSALGLSFARIFDTSLVDVLAESNRSSILATPEDSYKLLRVCWHAYLRSRDESGNAVWRYRVFDFSGTRTPGHLHTVVEVIRDNGNVHRFVYDGYICGHHLILVGQPAMGKEEHVVHVFPDALKSQSDTLSGLCFVDSFDNSRLVAPTVLSNAPLTKPPTPGRVPADQAEKIYQIWKAQLGSQRQLNFDPGAFKAVHK